MKATLFERVSGQRKPWMMTNLIAKRLDEDEDDDADDAAGESNCSRTGLENLGRRESSSIAEQKHQRNQK
jgi:hypothetical protein